MFKIFAHIGTEGWTCFGTVGYHLYLKLVTVSKLQSFEPSRALISFEKNELNAVINLVIVVNEW